MTSTSAATKNAAAPNNTAGTCPCLLVKDLVPSSIKQPRTHFAKIPLDQLAESIRINGVLEPLLVRPARLKKNVGKHEIVCGERRWRAAQLVSLLDVPVVIRDLDDRQAFEAMIAENLHREDLHPLEEALSYQQLMEMSNLSIKETARQVAQEETYVARRLSLIGLIEPARKAFADNRLQIGHALVLAPLNPDVQTKALHACFEGDRRDGGAVDKNNPISVRALQKWIDHNVLIDLSHAPWSLADATLVVKQGACTTCTYRSGTNPGLFPDATGENICTNPIGYETKMQAWLQRAAATIQDKTGKPAVFVSPEYSAQSYRDIKVKIPPGTKFRDDYQAVTGGRKCEFARGAVIVEGKARGQQMTVCVERKCKDHLGRVNASYDRGSQHTSKQSPAEFRKRKQELFDIKVNEAARRQIFKDALPKIPKHTVPPSFRRWLNRVALEWMLRIPSKTVAVIAEVFGREELSSDAKRADRTRKLIEDLGSVEIEQLLALMSFAHFGENEYGHNQVDQRQVVALASELKLNYALRDAEARLVFVSRKARAVHETYLAEVKAGKKPAKPSIFVDPLPASKPKGKAKAAGAR